MHENNSLSKWIAYVVIVAMLAGNISPAYAATNIVIDNSGTGEDHWKSGYANTSYLYTTNDGTASDTNWQEDYSHWVGSGLDDIVTMEGGELRTSGLTDNALLKAYSGSISVLSGKLSIADGSFINNSVSLALSSSATLAQTGGSVTINSGDSINSGTISATGGNLTFESGTHTISSGSSIANNMNVKGGTVTVSEGATVTNSLNVTDGTVTFAKANSLGTGVTNAGSLAFNSGTLNQAISGDGNTTFNGTVTNTASVGQTSVTNNAALTNNAAISANLTNTNAITGTGSIVTGTGVSSNNSTISQNSLTNNGTFTSNGQITLANGLTNNATFTNNAMLLASVTNISDSVFNSDPDNLGDDVANDGTLNLNGDGTLSVEVSGNGITNINGDLDNQGNISQHDITVAAGKVVTTNASNMTTNTADGGAITNSGTIHYTGGTTANTINGSGRIDITGYVTNDGDITQNKVTNSGVFTNNGTVTANLTNTNAIEGTGSITTGTGVSSNSGTIEQASLTNNGTFDNEGHVTLTGTLTNNNTFNTNADLIAAAGGVNNAGNFNITGGTNTNAITGGGTTNFSNAVTNNAAINQSNVTNSGTLTNNALITANVTNDGTLTSAGNNINGNIANTGTYVITTGNNANVISGTGTTTIQGTTVNSKDITQGNLNVANSGNLTTNSDLIHAAINNAGSMTWNAGTGNANVITGAGTLNVTGGNITNTAAINQGNIAITGGSLTSNADLLTSTNGISNEATLNLSGGTNNNAITGEGTLGITGNVLNNASVSQDTVSIGSGKQFTTNADLLSTTTGVSNAGTLNVTGGTNTNAITGAGTTNFSNAVTNNNTINQTSVTNSGTLTNNALITASVTNTGTLVSDGNKISGAIANTGTYVVTDEDNANNIIGEGGKVSFLGDTTNTGTIMQETLTIANSGNLTTNSDLVTASITNDGKLTWNAGTANANVINGVGQLDITNGNITNSAAISQDKIKITGGSLTSNADLLASASGITNNVANGLTFTGGTNTNVIDGSGSLKITTGNVVNQAEITQDTITVTNNGTLTTLADLLTTSNDITNNGAISFTGGVNENDITGTGVTYIDGTVENNATIDTEIGVNTNGHYVTTTNISKDLENYGITDLIGDGVNGANVNAAIDGTGTLNILGKTVNNSTISQSTVNVASNGQLTTASDTITAAVTNDGKLTWNAGSANSNVIGGEGTLDITGGTIANTAAISQNKINIANGATLTSNADLLASIGGIKNEGTLGFSGGTNLNTITGAGALTTDNDVTNQAAIAQTTVTVQSGSLVNGGTIAANVTVNNGAVLASDGDDIDGDITNNGTYAIVDGNNSNDISGAQGALKIFGNTTNTGEIGQKTISIENGATFVAADMTDVSATNGINNAGTLEMQSGTNNNVITGNTGALKVTGTVTNTSGKSITQDNIDIATLGVFTADAGDLHTVNGITNSGALSLGDGNNTNNISGTGALAITGTVNNSGTISQQSLSNTGTFTSDASLLALADRITNDNKLNLTGGTNTNLIEGIGTTKFTGNVINDAAITQTTVTNEGTLDNNAAISGAITNSGTINSTATNLVGAVNNSGTLNVAGGEVQAAINGASGVMNITDDLVNAYSITQATVTNDAVLTNSGAITAAVVNNGTIDNSNVITGTITNNGTINSTANNLNGAVTNDGTLNVAGGTTQNTISGIGDMNITADLVADHTINQASVTNGAALTNNTTITATDIFNNGTITGKASDLIASHEIVNEGTLEFNAASTGSSNISGSGDIQVTKNTTLTGSNSFTGGSLVSGATLTVADATNLGTGAVSFAGNGVLAVTGDGVSLDNVLQGAAATNDIIIDNAAALTLNTATGLAKDFIKNGGGTLTLAMASNGYTGDTRVNAGYLIGNTGNINNAVIGAAGTTVEFNDTADADLNEINTLGNFVQSGSAVLNVHDHAFSAAQADINAGTFAANGNVTATLFNVNNGATLRGNGNILGTVNVNAGGTIAPGNSIDTLTITGDLNLVSGSTTAIEIDETPASDKIVVTGATDIASGANLTVSNQSGRYFEWKEFEIINSGNVTGEFTYDGTVTDYDASRIEVEVDYSDPTKVLLTAKRKATDYAGTTAGLPRNASEAARAMDAVSTGFSGDITNALLQLEELGGLNPTGVTLINPGSTLLSALNDLHGVLYANSALTPLFNAKTAHVYDRIAKRNPSTGKCTTCHDNVWAEYYSQHDRVYADENSPRFANNMTGVLVGYDRASEDVLLGVYGGFGKSDLRQQSDKMDIEDTTLGVYGGYMTGDWMFKGTLFGGMQHYNGKRLISFMDRKAEGKYDGMNVGLDLEASYSIPVDTWLNVKPFFGWLNNYSHQQSFTEKGADSLNLHVSHNDQFNSQARLGFELNGKIKNRFSWYGSVAVKQFVGDDYAKVRANLNLPNTRMDIISAELGRTSFSGQVGANYAISNNWSIFANLDTGVSNKSKNCYGNAGIAYTW